MQKIFNMNKQEIAQGLSQFVMMAFIGPQNIETGFLTRHCIKKMTKERRSLKVPWNPILAKDSTYPIQEEWNISNAM